ncbi:MAG: hypothetical protein QGG28_06065 [Alphaproteobacteria bacterium]|nr:hypothetical protein [Alphaproteobacteria bacterium]
MTLFHRCIQKCGHFKILRLHRKALKVIANFFIGDLVGDNNYHQDDAAITARSQAYRNFMIGVCRHLVQRLELDVALTANFSFYAEQEFAAALGHFDIPVVAMHKECIKTPGVEPFYEETYRERKMPFQGRLITTYNEIERRIEINAGVAPADRIVATGAPRLDRFHQYRREHAGRDQSLDGRPTVLFMSFNDRTGCPVLGRRGDDRFEALDPELEKINFSNLSRNCLGAMIRLAREYPEIHVIIKSKNHVLAVESLNAGLEDDTGLPENLEVLVGGNSFDLIVGSDVLCTINSGSLFEALAANVEVVSPHFDEAATPLAAPFMVDLGASAARANSADELVSIVAEKALSRPAKSRGAELSEASRQALDQWVNNSDGDAGERVSRIIMEMVDERRQRTAAKETDQTGEIQTVGG